MSTIYSAALSDFPLREALIKPLIVDKKVKEIFWSAPEGKSRRFIYRVGIVLYITFYYYFMPYVTPVLTYLVAGQA